MQIYLRPATGWFGQKTSLLHTSDRPARQACFRPVAGHYLPCHKSVIGLLQIVYATGLFFYKGMVINLL